MPRETLVATQRGSHTQLSPAGQPVDTSRLLEPLFSSISCTIFRAGRYILPPDWHLTTTALACSRLVIAVSGTAACLVGGEPHRLEAGGVLLVPAHTMHDVRNVSGTPLIAYIIDFEARLHGILDVPSFCGLPVSLMPSPLRRKKIASSAGTIVHHLVNCIPGYQLALHTHCVRLLDLLWKETIARQPPELASRPASADACGPLEVLRLRPVFALVEARYAGHVSLAELAGAIPLHPAYFCTVFKRVTGMAPHEYLARYRIERARDLLLASNLPLEEIARRTGFYDAAHLIRVFRRIEGVPPGRYRRSLGRPGSRITRTPAH